MLITPVESACRRVTVNITGNAGVAYPILVRQDYENSRFCVFSSLNNGPKDVVVNVCKQGKLAPQKMWHAYRTIVDEEADNTKIQSRIVINTGQFTFDWKASEVVTESTANFVQNMDSGSSFRNVESPACLGSKSNIYAIWCHILLNRWIRFDFSLFSFFFSFPSPFESPAVSFAPPLADSDAGSGPGSSTSASAPGVTSPVGTVSASLEELSAALPCTPTPGPGPPTGLNADGAAKSSVGTVSASLEELSAALPCTPTPGPPTGLSADGAAKSPVGTLSARREEFNAALPCCPTPAPSTGVSTSVSVDAAYPLSPPVEGMSEGVDAPDDWGTGTACGVGCGCKVGCVDVGVGVVCGVEVLGLRGYAGVRGEEAGGRAGRGRGGRGCRGGRGGSGVVRGVKVLGLVATPGCEKSPEARGKRKRMRMQRRKKRKQCGARGAGARAWWRRRGARRRGPRLGAGHWMRGQGAGAMAATLHPDARRARLMSGGGYWKPSTRETARVGAIP
ncbi:hypothetical protein K438DRAFT_2112954 [Mycena galopus ATCC 62051]|nr:hypothetical protein K438DRAFT_2112954 [Mycena galopus ATCC 62051]